MLKRKILDDLIKWKNKKNHKSLIITGQRQIGKTYVIDKMFSKEYKSYISFNFVLQNDAKDIFNGNLDIDTLINNIKAYNTSFKLIENNTLILLDEIQECDNAITALKTFTEDGRFDVIGMGSSLGINYSSKKSYPVGKVEYINMYSLDFEEFLWALNVDSDLILELRKYYVSKKRIPDVLNIKMWEYLRLYMVIGGMPEVVDEYVNSKDLSIVHNIQTRLLNDYSKDIARFATGSEKIKAQKCYDTIPLQLTKENHKFQYKEVENKATSTKFFSSVDWLKNQLLVVKINNLKSITYPLDSYQDDDNFRLYPSDIGMLIGKYDESLKKAIINDKKIENKSSSLLLRTAKGGLYEALAADMLYKSGYSKIYFYKHEKNTSEIEFIIQKGDDIVPIEIKAGREKANSLKNILNDNEYISYGYKMSSNNIGVNGKLITMPLYLLMFV